MRPLHPSASPKPLRSFPFDFEVAFAVSVSGAIIAALAATWLAPASLVSWAQPFAIAAVLAAGFAWRPAAGLLAFAIFILGYETLAIYLGEAIKRTDEVTIPAIVLVALVRLQPWRTWQWSPLREGGLALLIFAGIVSSLNNDVPLQTWAPALALIAKPIAVLYVAMWLPVDRHTFVSGARIILTIGVAVAVLGLIEAFDQRAFQQAIGLPEWVRPRGTLPSIKSVFRHPAVFAWFMSFLALYCFVAYVELRHRWLLGLGFLFSVATFLTARRRAIGAALATLFLAFAWTVRRVRRLPEEARRWAPVFATTALVVVAFIPGLVGLYDRTLDRYVPSESPTASRQPSEEPIDDEGPGTAQARVALYLGSLEIAQDHFPLGAGMGRYGSWMSRLDYSPIYHEYGLDQIRGLRERNSQYATDTFWPMVLGEFGVVGLAGYAALLASVGIALWRAGRRRADALTRAFIVGSLAVFTSALIESVATPMFTSPPRTYLLFAVIGAALAYSRLHDAPSDPEPVSELSTGEEGR